MAYTAAMTKGTTWTGLLSNVMPVVRKKVTDLKRTTHPILPAYQMLGITTMDDPTLFDLDLFIENEDSGPTPVSTGYETITPTTTDQPHGIPISDSYYLDAIQMSDIEMDQSNNASTIVGLLQSRYYKKNVAIEKTISLDLCQANQVGNALRITSLEQLIPPYIHSGSGADSTTFDKWKFRQATNAVNNVTRTAWTSATAGGTDFEPLSFKGLDTNLATGASRFGLTTNQNPNAALVMLNHLCLVASDGGDGPDVFFCTRLPYEDLLNCERGKIRYMGTPTEIDGMPKFPMYQNKILIYSPDFVTSGLVGDATAGLEQIYGVSSETLRLKIPRNWFFTETDWLDVPMSPMAHYMAFKFAGQHKFIGRPDRNFSWWNYGSAT